MKYLAALIALWPSLAIPQDVVPYHDETRIEMSFGVYCEVESSGSVEAPDTAAGQIDLLEQVPEFIWDTDLVPAYPGMSFGVRTFPTGPFGIADVTIVLTHPPFVDSGVTRQTYITDIGTDGPSINAYTFDFREELVTGVWTFEAIAGNETLYRVDFTVVPAEELPQIAGNCVGDLLS